MPHAGTRYALLRLLMLVVVGAALYVVGLRGWLLAFAAVLVSGLISLFLLMKQRNDAAVSLERSLDQWRARHAEDEEDAADQGPEHDPDGDREQGTEPNPPQNADRDVDRENDTHQPPAGQAGSGT